MGNPAGFLEHNRELPGYRPTEERIQDSKEMLLPFPRAKTQNQATRCVECGVPFCQYGCPVSNLMPEWNALIEVGRWDSALELLHSTNNFPEFTGRVCPALCEEACTLNIDEAPVAIKQIELEIIERGFSEGWVRPEPPKILTGKQVAVIGSGPAGLAAAQQLRRAGHEVTVFEKDDRAGGLLRYGIPDFKLDKQIIDRRLEQMDAEGVRFETDVHVGQDISARYLLRRWDSIVLAVGAQEPRDMPIPGRGLEGVHYAMPFLSQQNRRIMGDAIPSDRVIHAKGLDVLVIGGGDTGADCVGVSRRQGAKSITQIEILPKPPEKRTPDMPWPEWPSILRTSTSHQEGCERRWSLLTKGFEGEDGRVKKALCTEVDWDEPFVSFQESMHEVPGSETGIKADLVLLALGFVHAKHSRLLTDFELAYDGRGNVSVDKYGQTSKPDVFAIGDAAMGATLIVHAISSGRRVAQSVDRFLKENL